MRVLAHISDLHFGRIGAGVLHGLADALRKAEPDLLVVSGDLTQRARLREFEEARAFLDAVPFPRLVVPGNHDIVPWSNPLGRWRRAFAGYTRMISQEMEQVFSDGEILVAGINSVRRNTTESGRLNEKQVARLCERMSAAPPDCVRMIVSHHPFDLPQHYRGHDIVGRAGMAMSAFARCGVDAFLSGHLHVSHIGESTLRYRISGYSALVIQAGTATSTRARGELNSWNLIRIAPPEISVERYSWDRQGGAFLLSGCDLFRRTGEGWQRTGNRAA